MHQIDPKSIFPKSIYEGISTTTRWLLGGMAISLFLAIFISFQFLTIDYSEQVELSQLPHTDQTQARYAMHVPTILSKHAKQGIPVVFVRANQKEELAGWIENQHLTPDGTLMLHIAFPSAAVGTQATLEGKVHIHFGYLNPFSRLWSHWFD